MMRGMLLRACVGLVLLFPCAVAQPPVRLLDSYATGNTLHLIIKNEGADALLLSPSGLRDVTTSFSPPVWWARAFPAALAPGQEGRVSLALKRPLAKPAGYNVMLGPFELAATLSSAPSTVEINQLIVDTEKRQVSLFLENTGGESLSVDALRIDDIDIPISSVAPIPPCDIGLILGALPTDTAFAPDQPVLLAIRTGAGEMHRHAFAFQSPTFAVRSGEIPNAFICPTHRHGPLDRAADAMFALAPLDSGLLPEAHFCRNRLPEGLDALGQCLPRAAMNLQASNLRRGQPDAWQGLRDVAAHARSRTRPGLYAAVIEPESNFQGEFGQPMGAATAAMTPRDLRHTIYAALAGGADGLVFRMGETPDANYRTLVDAMSAEFSLLSPWLLALEPVTLPVAVSLPGVSVATLYAGPDALLLICLSDAASPVISTRPLHLSLEPPAWFSPGVLLQIGGEWRREALPEGLAPIDIEVPAFDDAAAFLVHAGE